MKKVLLFIIGIFSIILLSSCNNSASATYVVNNITYIVDKVENKIYDGTYTYEYTISGDKYKYTIEFIYPDDSKYSITYSSNSNGGVFTGDFTIDGINTNNKYASLNTLSEVVVKTDINFNEVNIDPTQIILGVVLIGVGLFNVLLPSVAWYIERGWWYKNAQPSEIAIVFTRLSGVIVIIAGIVFMFI